MVVRYEIEADDLGKIADDLTKFGGRVLKRSAASITPIFKMALASAISSRGVMGVTGNLSSPSNWLVQTRRVDRNLWIVTADNPSAPYYTYIDNPRGGYPTEELGFDEKLLSDWIWKKFPSLTDEQHKKAYTTIYENIAWEGHKWKRGEGFIGEAFEKMLSHYDQKFSTIVDKEFEGI